MDQAQGYIGGQLAGKNAFQAQANPYEGQTTQVGTNQYAGANPHLNDMIGNAQRDVTESFQNSTQPNMLAQFNAGGAFGGSAMQ
ncbi:hypothetical protein ACFQZQ_02855 [Lysobacter koreensis]|uniref:Uncharacterized protein n=1 Tax=Lysobacter koreensis TaxID=266122 RepID=A0ABW2YL81_9GAMM